ncbi:hypothetical protein EV138_0571 [Kribbella voronezhensis]|uniref:Uncharacterized protein n=1 Tax=Kribbella voronezhensis TaxID=2512212 RepID=A0A4R7T5C2_9ACTN|nr:hypothetical protein EV138_0571 [Kribbella voronezhensis]
MVGAALLVVVALLTALWSVNWIWSKADAVTPVAVPSAKQTPLKTVNPSASPSPTPPPVGKVVGSNIVAFNNDTMPLMSSQWSDNFDRSGMLGGAATWLTVHAKYDGKGTWGNFVSFGQLPKDVPYSNTPAGLKAAAQSAGGMALTRLYDANTKPYAVTHRPITVAGHPGHEITARIPVKVPKLKETYSVILIAVIDRGDGTAAVSIGDIAGSTPQWLPVWRSRVAQIKING